MVPHPNGPHASPYEEQLQRAYMEPSGVEKSVYDIQAPERGEVAGSGVEKMLDVGEAAGNPFGLFKAILKALQLLETQSRLERLATEKLVEHLQAGRRALHTWRAFPFSYEAADGVRELELTNHSNMSNMFISTVVPAGGTDGVFYLSFNQQMELSGSGVDVLTSDFVGKIGGESLTFPIPRGVPRVFIWGSSDFEGVVYAATSKDALPS